MNFIKTLGKSLLKNEQGYGTVELLIIIGVLGLVAITSGKKLTTNLAGDSTSTNSATDKVVTNVNSLVTQWNTTP